MESTNVLFEVGLEEMPARFLADTEAQLLEKTSAWLNEARLSFTAIDTFVTPRRLAVLIKGLATEQPDLSEEAKGPQKSIAVDAEGNWTKAAMGFAKGQGQPVENLFFQTYNDVEYVYVNKFISGKEATSILPDFKSVILSLNFPKNMRWADRNLRFVRPIKWLLALNDEAIIPFEIEGVKTDRFTKGHRFLGKTVALKTATDYESLLRQEHVVANVDQRKQIIVDQIEAIATEKNWKINIDEDLLEEVTQLVELPTAFSGHFDPAFLIVPEEALITSMREHQRYFPVRDVADQLLPYFIAIRNGNAEHIETVARGNEKVLNARLKDAVFFYEEDQKHSIEENNEKLTRMVFQEKLGTLAEKVNRVAAISTTIANELDLNEAAQINVSRAAEISKFDLVTQMVNEFTNLQGVMGEKYALLMGEPEEVAMAINEQYMPRHSQDKTPSTTIGQILSVADKMDTIVGSIAVGLIPTGSQDPYALRRQSLGVIQIAKHAKWNVSFETLLNHVLELFITTDIDIENPNQVKMQVKDFFMQRMLYLAKENHIQADTMRAVMHNNLGVVHDTFEIASILEAKRQDPSFKATQEAIVRAMNLAKKATTNDVKPTLFENEFEEQLYLRIKHMEGSFNQFFEEKRYQEAIELLASLVPAIDNFFEETMVMAKDETVKANRLALLALIKTMVDRIADFTYIEWKQHA